MANKIQFRRDTAANWTSANPLLSQGELGFETNTNKIKIGNGTQYWVDLAYTVSPDRYNQDLYTTSTVTFAGLSVNSDAIKLGNGSQLDTYATDAVAVGKDSFAQGAGAVSIGNSSLAQTNAVSIGKESEASGNYSVSIGYRANNSSGDSFSNAIVINGSGATLSPNASGLFVNPIRSVSNTKILTYNTATSEITYSTPAPVASSVYARNALPAGVTGLIITISDSGSDTNAPAGNYAPAYWDPDNSVWTYIGNSNSVTAV